MSSKIQPAVPKKSKKSSKQDELIYKNKIKEDGQDERLKEKAAQYRLFENNDTFQTALKPNLPLSTCSQVSGASASRCRTWAGNTCFRASGTKKPN